MKRFILLLIGAMFCINSQAQTLTEFNKSSSYKITYDDYFTPTVHVTVNNISSKTITSIEVTVSYTTNPREWSAPTHSEIVRVYVTPGEAKTVSFQVPDKIRSRTPGRAGITRIRFSDGSICDIDNM